MNTVKIKNITIGEGKPKICVPIVGETKEEILKEARAIASDSSVDIAEWRSDWFEEADDTEKVTGVLKELRKELREIPLLFTFRTAKEGGRREIAVEKYVDLNKKAAKSGFADLIDAEIFMGDKPVKEIIEAAHKSGVKVIASNHDFDKTPDKKELLERLLKMQEMGADILKIAVMPKTERDVLELLLATEEMHTNYAKKPLVTMSMGGAGMVSRLCGEVFGSAITFGTMGKKSAPGQIPVRELEEILDLFHRNL